MEEDKHSKQQPSKPIIKQPKHSLRMREEGLTFNTINNQNERTISCFISMPFSPDFEHVFLKGLLAVTKYLPNYKIDLVRLDKETYKHRQIEENVLKNIDSSDMLIADITRYKDALQPNVSVMHEIGYASGRDIPFILIGRKDTYKSLPSNLKGSQLIEYDPDNDRELRNFTQRLAQQMARVN